MYVNVYLLYRFFNFIMWFEFLIKYLKVKVLGVGFLVGYLDSCLEWYLKFIIGNGVKYVNK